MKEDVSLYAEDALQADEVKVPGIIQDANRVVQLTEELEALELAAEKTKKELNELRLHTLPDKLREAGVKEVALSDGWKIELVRQVQGTLPKGDGKMTTPERRAEAIAALRRRGGDELLKNTVTVLFDRGKDNLVGEVVNYLRKEYDIEPQVKEDVHAQTLCAWARRQLDEVPDLQEFLEEAEKIGLFIADIVEVKPPKRKK